MKFTARQFLLCNERKTDYTDEAYGRKSVQKIILFTHLFSTKMKLNIRAQMELTWNMLKFERCMNETNLWKFIKFDVSQTSSAIRQHEFFTLYRFPHFLGQCT